MILLAAGQAAKSENPDLTRSLRTVANRVDGPTGELAEIAACWWIASLGVVERRAALALLDDFTTYARRRSRRR